MLFGETGRHRLGNDHIRYAMRRDLVAAGVSEFKTLDRIAKPECFDDGLCGVDRLLMNIQQRELHVR